MVEDYFRHIHLKKDGKELLVEVFLNLVDSPLQHTSVEVKEAYELKISLEGQVSLFCEGGYISFIRGLETFSQLIEDG